MRARPLSISVHIFVLCCIALHCIKLHCNVHCSWSARFFSLTILLCSFSVILFSLRAELSWAELGCSRYERTRALVRNTQWSRSIVTIMPGVCARLICMLHTIWYYFYLNAEFLFTIPFGLFTFVLCVDLFYFDFDFGPFRSVWLHFIPIFIWFGLFSLSLFTRVCNVCALLFSRVKFIVVVVVVGVFFLRFWKFGLWFVLLFISFYFIRFYFISMTLFVPCRPVLLLLVLFVRYLFICLLSIRFNIILFLVGCRFFSLALSLSVCVFVLIHFIDVSIAHIWYAHIYFFNVSLLSNGGNTHHSLFRVLLYTMPPI